MRMWTKTNNSNMCYLEYVGRGIISDHQKL